MSNDLRKRKFPANEYIFKEGELGTDAYLILDGNIQIRKGAFGDNPRVLATLGKGDVIGEMALFDDKPHMASAMAMDEITVAMLSSSDFKKRVSDMDVVMRGILAIMIQRVRIMGGKEIIKTSKTDFGSWDK